MTALMAEAVTPEPFPWMAPEHEWNLDDLARLPEDGRRYEIIDGSLVVSPGPAFVHQRTVGWLHIQVQSAAPPGRLVVPGANILLPAPRVRLLIPDVLAVRDGPELDDLLAVPANAVLLVVEITSPSSVTMDRVTKRTLYAEAGVPSYWHVEQEAGGPAVHVHTLAGGAYIPTGVVRAGETAHLDAPWPVTIAPPRRTRPGAQSP
jgi:Uma2 family endonuclease